VDINEPRAGELTRASLLCCGLFVVEDPGIIAARRALGDVWSGTAPGIAIDVLLAVTMTAYNYAASRYVVTVGEAASIDAAMRRLAEVRSAGLDVGERRWRRVIKRLLRRLNPLNLIRLTAERFAGVVDRLRAEANQRALAGVAEVMGELAAVNVLGVAGAGLESVARSERVSSRTSLRHSALFVASWFAGARLLGVVLNSLYAIPGAGQGIATITAFVGRTFDTLTDVRRPIGAATVVVVTAAVVRYSRTVERVAASI
jgi:CBS domain-containing protein